MKTVVTEKAAGMRRDRDQTPDSGPVAEVRQSFPIWASESFE
jgi:hypothetical protein